MEHRDGSNEDEILSTSKFASIAAGFLAAGSETVNNLSFTSYLLAMHPEEQEKVQSEIDEWFENNVVSSNTSLCMMMHEINSINSVSDSSFEFNCPC